MVSGERFQYTDPKMKELVRLVSDVTASLNFKPRIGFVFPKLREIFPSVDYLGEKSDKMEVTWAQTIINDNKENTYISGHQVISKKSYSSA